MPAKRRVGLAPLNPAHACLLEVLACNLTAAKCSAQEGFEERWFCQSVSELSQQQNEAIRRGDGVWADASTENLGTFASCQMRAVTFAKKLHFYPSDLREGWKARKQRQWNSNYCGDDTWIWREAIEHGWKVRTKVTFLDGTQEEFTAKCD